MTQTVEQSPNLTHAHHTLLTQSCEILPGVGPTLAKKLAKCQLHTLQDILFHLPYRYQDRTRVTPIRDCRANEWCVVAGQITDVSITRRRRNILHCVVTDLTGSLVLRFFHFNSYQVKAFQSAPSLRIFGEVRIVNGEATMVHPEYQVFDPSQPCPIEETLTPIYTTTQGLTQRRLRQLVTLTFTQSQATLSHLEWLTPTQLAEQGFMALPEALAFLHAPTPDTTLEMLESGRHPAIRRLAFDELLAQQLCMKHAKQQRLQNRAVPCPENPKKTQALLAELPFKLTNAQERVYAAINQDLSQAKPMLRLVQGDVGAGKTVIAALAALQVIQQGYQVALMAPTDILSEQHAETLIPWFNALGYTIERLTGKVKPSERRRILESIANESCQLIIGTHALFQNDVSFPKLGLVIIDEQHRFGVEQRFALNQKGQQDNCLPHQLLLTATPIPRTLAMAHFAHMELSTLDELPPGRTPVKTAVLNQTKRDDIITRLNAALASGRQAYWVCTIIEESETLQCQAATDTAESLQTALPDAKVGLIHGRMKAAEKEATMDAFKQGTLQLLVATTVIEVGVNVPNASVMIIENAERLGLSQLHQLRGRVGRGEAVSHCLLLYQPPLSEQGRSRLQVLRDTNDGFIIAEKDMALRGSGEILGTRQTGYRQFKIAVLPRDIALIQAIPNLVSSGTISEAAIAERMIPLWHRNMGSYFET